MLWRWDSRTGTTQRLKPPCCFSRSSREPRQRWRRRWCVSWWWALGSVWVLAWRWSCGAALARAISCLLPARCTAAWATVIRELGACQLPMTSPAPATQPAILPTSFVIAASLTQALASDSDEAGCALAVAGAGRGRRAMQHSTAPCLIAGLDGARGSHTPCPHSTNAHSTLPAIC